MFYRPGGEMDKCRSMQVWQRGQQINSGELEKVIEKCFSGILNNSIYNRGYILLSTYSVLGLVNVTYQGKSLGLGSGGTFKAIGETTELSKIVYSRRKNLDMINEEGERGQWTRAKAGETGWDQMMKDPDRLSLPHGFVLVSMPVGRFSCLPFFFFFKCPTLEHFFCEAFLCFSQRLLIFFFN